MESNKLETGKLPKNNFATGNIATASEKSPEEILIGDNVIRMILNGDSDDVNAITQWLCSDVPLRDLGEKKNTDVTSSAQENVATLMDNLLNFANNDLQSTRLLLKKLSFMDRSGNRNSMSVTAGSLYRPQSDSEEYPVKNLKVRLMAFWLDAYVGGLGPRSSNFEGMLENVYPKSDVDLKTQMMIYVKENLYARKVPKIKYFVIERAVDKEMAEKAKRNDSNLALLNECNEVKRILEGDRLIEQTEGGEITIEGLVNLLEKSPFLLKYISDKELRVVLGRTKSDNLYVKLSRLIKEQRQHGK